MRGIEGTGWTIDHQVFLWSPKGFFTGSQTTPNSIMFSFGFERGDMDCGQGCDASPGAGSFHSNTVLNREAALWYWVRPSFGIGTWFHYWTMANTPVRTQVATGCKDNITAATSREVARAGVAVLAARTSVYGSAGNRKSKKSKKGRENLAPFFLL